MLRLIVAIHVVRVNLSKNAVVAFCSGVSLGYCAALVVLWWR